MELSEGRIGIGGRATRDAERVRFGWNNLQAPIHEDCGKHS